MNDEVAKAFDRYTHASGKEKRAYLRDCQEGSLKSSADLLQARCEARLAAIEYRRVLGDAGRAELP